MVNNIHRFQRFNMDFRGRFAAEREALCHVIQRPLPPGGGVSCFIPKSELTLGLTLAMRTRQK